MLRMFSLSWFEKFFRPSVEITGTVIDWRMGECFYKTLMADVSFTFANLKDGKAITVVLDNVAATPVNVIFPAGIYKDASFDATVESGKVNVYTFARIGGKIVASFVSKMDV